MKKFVSGVLVVFCAMAAFCGPAGNSEAQNGDPVAASARKAIEKGAEWLIAQQGTNGVWSNQTFPALTAMPLWALSKTEHAGEGFKKGVEFVRSCAQEDGGIYVVVPGRRGGALGTYNTAICMTALYYADKAGSIGVIQKAREYVASTQLSGDDGNEGTAGGFGYEKNSPAHYADLNNSAWAISAMRVTQDVEEMRPAGEKKVDIDWAKALAFVDKMQVKAGDEGVVEEDVGGFLYKREDGKIPAPPEGGKKSAVKDVKKRPPLRSYGSITYSGLEAMIFAQVTRDDPRVVYAVYYARRHWTLDENPGMGEQGIYYYYTIMARALSLLGVNELPAIKEGDPTIKWRDELIAKVVSLQKPDGSWVNKNNRFWEGDPVLSSFYAMLTLEYALGLFK